jgi:hypothetical protein
MLAKLVSLTVGLIGSLGLSILNIFQQTYSFPPLRRCSMLDRFIYWIKHPIIQYTIIIIFIKLILISIAFYIYFISDSVLSICAIVPLDLKPNKDKPIK